MTNQPTQWIVASQAPFISEDNPFGFSGDFLDYGWDALYQRIEDCRRRGIERAIVQQIFGAMADGDMRHDMWPRLVEFAQRKPRSTTAKLASEADFRRAVIDAIGTGFELIGKIGTLRNVSYMGADRLALSTKPLTDNNCAIGIDSAASQPWDSITNGLLCGLSVNHTCYIEAWPTGDVSHMAAYPAFCLERYLTGKRGRPTLEDAINAPAERMVILTNRDYPTPQKMADRANQLMAIGVTPVISSTQLKFNGKHMEAA
jgi:hypothetical protein